MLFLWLAVISCSLSSFVTLAPITSGVSFMISDKTPYGYSLKLSNISVPLDLHGNINFVSFFSSVFGNMSSSDILMSL